MRPHRSTTGRVVAPSRREEWAYRFLGAALAHHEEDRGGRLLFHDLPAAGGLSPPDRLGDRT